MTIETPAESIDLSVLARSLQATCGDIVYLPGDPGTTRPAPPGTSPSTSGR
jgi:hypothetical protein